MACNTVTRYPNINVTGTFTPQGLSNGGKYTIFTINDSSWTALPPTPLVNRNTVSIINISGSKIKINHSLSVVGYEGATLLPNEGERSYPIRDTITIYAKAEPGAGTISIATEELA